jgi:hypothetical protein
MGRSRSSKHSRRGWTEPRVRDAEKLARREKGGDEGEWFVAEVALDE